MKNNNGENIFMKISPISFPFKSISQTNVSKDNSIFNQSNESMHIDPINMGPMGQSFKDFSKYIHIVNYQSSNKRDFSMVSTKDNYNESDRGKMNNNLIKGNVNFNPLIKKTYYETIRYKPKRSTNFPSLKLNIQNNKNIFRNGKVDIERPIKRLKMENNIKSSDNILELYKERIDEEMINRDFTINNKKMMSFKSQQIQFFSKISNDYNLFKKFVKLFSEQNKLNIYSYLNQLSNLLEIQRNILFVDNINYNYLENPEKSENDKNDKINKDNQVIKSSDKKRINKSEQKIQNLFDNKTILKYMNINAEYNTTLIKCFDLIFNELKELKEKNNQILKINYENDILLSKKNKELDKYTNLNQFKKYIDSDKKKETIFQKKNNKKENKYILDNYRLNYEMKDLILLLDRNRDYYNKYKEIEKREKINISENNYIKNHLTNELAKKDAQFLNEVEMNNDLNEEIIKLEGTITELKEKNEKLKIEEVQFNSKMQRLFNIINERNEVINMMNEEIDNYYLMYKKEIQSHQATKLLLSQYKKN